MTRRGLKFLPVDINKSAAKDLLLKKVDLECHLLQLMA